MNRPTLGLAAKLGVCAALLILLTTVSLAISLAVRHQQRQSEAFREMGLGLAKTMAEQVQMGVFSGSADELERIAHGASAFPDVASVAVYDASGRFLARHAKMPAERAAPVLPANRPRAQPAMLGELDGLLPEVRQISFIAPVLMPAGPAMPGVESSPQEQEPLGHVVVSMSTASLREQLVLFMETALGAAALMGLLGVAVMAMLARHVLQPLREVTVAAGQVAAGHLEHQVSVRSHDEAGVLARAFNAMTVQLREARDTLEQRVAERTRQLEEASAEAYRLAKHDALTGLPNRVLLRERLERGVDAAARRDSSVAVFFVDVDHFKAVNDSLGHDSGDLVLQAIAQRLTALIADDGFASRLGGDEFVVVHEALPRQQAAAMALALARRAIEAVCQPVALSGQEVRMGASIGVALFPEHGQDAATLLRAADTAMYAAKTNGRMGVQLFHADIEAPVRERLHLETDLRRALIDDEFEVWYQPQWSIDGQRLVGAEALVRWRHPERGLVSPALFIPVAETSGLIREIGAWVLEQAVCDARAWNTDKASPLRVAVNVSACQLNRSDIVETVAKALAAYRLPPALLELELTESGIVEDPEHGLQVLLRLQALGVQLSIDDFGTGFSSLSYLTRLPVNALKIDRSFVAGLPDARNDLAVVQAICAMAHKLGLKVVAEGVETPQQLELLQHIGCDMAQGYLLGKPMPQAEFWQLLLAKRSNSVPSSMSSRAAP
ncbi:putative bifunctional diguanylate cyclase/phosphodiesterase [Azohydromonas aeria]|uniref:putative bifunctional diguanylate cyclase/phosphodiesterase n=1 Tax=Azohydromonas aeria TaxID=2590212 RepID=UPI0012FCF07D|nr:EAL domain-containing protein [Azohydromonas aeria]